ncbi:MAG: histidine phosphatase family protein [Propionicimonas sp.]|nr:histidine phosphatase family protein [Propionicimonas sp.]
MASPRGRRLYVMRHAQAAAFAASGGGDSDRPLTGHGREQAQAVGRLLAGAGIERLLVSSAARARQTAAELGLAVSPTVIEALYNCPASRIATEVSRLPEYVTAVLVVGHYPGIPGLVHSLADPASDRDELGALARLFPPATLVELAVGDPWSQLHRAHLVAVHRP